MGQPNPDRVPLRRRARLGRTVADMIHQHWAVIATCQVCNISLVVDLRVTAIVLGPDFVLWNRHARCKRVGCTGFVDFQAKSPDMSWFEALTMPEAELGELTFAATQAKRT